MNGRFFLQVSSGGSFFGDPINMVLIMASLAVFYFFMLRPNQKRAKEAKQILENLQKGDKIVTNGGLHGKISKLEETTADIEIAKNTIITIEKNAISTELTAALQKK